MNLRPVFSTKSFRKYKLRTKNAQLRAYPLASEKKSSTNGFRFKKRYTDSRNQVFLKSLMSSHVTARYIACAKRLWIRTVNSLSGRNVVNIFIKRVFSTWLLGSRSLKVKML